MANAYTAALGSLSVTPPPGVPNPYMASQPNVDDLAVFAAGGMGTTFSSNEKKVVMPYLAMPWADGHHTQFKNGDIVFVSRHHEHGDLRHNIVELNKLNQVLRLGFDIYLKAFDGGYESIRDNDDDDDDMDTDSPFHFDNLYHLDHNSTDIRQNLLFDIRSRYRSAATLAKKSGALPSAESIFFHSSLHKYRLPGVDDNSSDELDLSLNVRIERSLKELRGQNLYKAAGADQKFLDSLVLGGTDAEDRAYQEVLDILLEQRMGLARYATNFAIGRHWNLLGMFLFLKCLNKYILTLHF